MTPDKLVKRARDLAAPFRVGSGKNFRLKDHSPGNTLKFGHGDRDRAREALVQGVHALSALQDKLYAQDQWAILLIFQAMDAAGKDGAIKHVMSGVNPQGCEVHSFKSPTSEELDHDFLWRCSKRVPERGRIGIFNRSYYEETLVVRVHPEILGQQKIPRKLLGQDLWSQRFEDIRAFERYLTRNGVVIRKFFLNVSRAEQKKRFLARINTPEKNWKFSTADSHERQFWNDYQAAYEETIRHTATKDAPWYVVPADNKWFTRLVVAAAVIEALDSLNLKYPKVGKHQRKELAAAKTELLAEK
jgi:PPK2 family polyphosphate:nucleotide phosphotransferase